MQIRQTDIESKIEALTKCRYFSSLSDEIKLELATCTNLFRYEPGEMVCWQGEDCAGLFIIHYGSVKLFRLSPKGRELIIRVFDEGESFNEVPVFDLGKNPMNVAALETSDIW